MQPFSELTGNEKLIEILRWIAVLPAAALGGLGAHLLAVIGNSPGCSRGMINPDESIVDRFFVVLVSNVAFGAATVIAGAKTAPRFRRPTAIVLAICLVFYSGMVFTWLVLRTSSFWDYMAVLVGAIAAVGATVHIHSEESKSGTLDNTAPFE